jgi:rhodanese-related sulfurtransferase
MTHDHAAGFLKLIEDAKRDGVREMSIDEYQRRQSAGETLILIDVREDHEWARGRLPGALHLSKGIVERDIERTIGDRDAPIVCQCGGGFRSVLVCESLKRMGYTNTWSLAGGYREWVAKGLPVETR